MEILIYKWFSYLPLQSRHKKYLLDTHFIMRSDGVMCGMFVIFLTDLDVVVDRQIFRSGHFPSDSLEVSQHPSLESMRMLEIF